MEFLLSVPNKISIPELEPGAQVLTFKGLPPGQYIQEVAQGGVN